MRWSQYPVNTTKETPADAEVVSHQLMLRAGLIRKLAAGLYTWMPLGLRAMRKVEQIVREEMNRAGALELLMPGVIPAELWVESGRWGEFGPELLRLKDRHERDFCLGPTHEEVITDIARNELKSYRQLPVNFYQMQMKFRDERRPRFGVMRAREFLMKDAYSFHLDQKSLQAGYDAMHKAYTDIFTRLGLKFRSVVADPGAIGGSGSEEFHVLADSGEDAIAFSDGDNYAANLEMAVALPPATPRAAASAALTEVATPGAKTIEEVTRQLKLPASKLVKTLLVDSTDGGVVALLVRGDHELNAVKAQKLEGVFKPLRMSSNDTIARATGAEAGFLGPGRFQGQDLRRPLRGRARGFRLRRKQEGRAPHRRELGARPAGSDCRRPAQHRRRATPRLRARARCRSRAASKWATSSSSAGNTASPWAPRCSTNPARRPRCTWGATESV